MKKLLIVLMTVLSLSSCMNENFIDTGKASGLFDGNMMEYLRAHKQDWDLTVEVIEYAGLTALFEGTDPQHKEITFFGPTNLSILRYMMDNRIDKVSDRSPEEWKGMMLKHVIKDKCMKADFSKGNSAEGGDRITALGDNPLRVYTYTETYNDQPEAGPTNLYIHGVSFSPYTIASADIEPNNGAVHALPYGYTFGKI